jgi:hypothetical protein
MSEDKTKNPKVGNENMIIKWLLDPGASIHAEKNVNGVLDEKPCNATINIADGKNIKPRGIGKKVIVDNKTNYPITI